MNDTGRNIVHGFRELRKFCHQVSSLLETSTGMMESDGWEITKPAAVFYSSRSITASDDWLPYEFCRFFKNSAFTHIVAFIAINLDDPYENSPVDYAVMSAGYIDFLVGKKHAKIAHWMSRWHFIMGDRRKDDGSPCIDKPQKTWTLDEDGEEPPAGVEKVVTLGYPLVEITDCEALRDKIVQPLIDLITKEARVGKSKKRQE